MPRCPQCGRPAPPKSDNAAFPFCSERCRLIDLGSWLSEEYRVPVGPDETERDGVSEDEAAGKVPPRGKDELPS